MEAKNVYLPKLIFICHEWGYEYVKPQGKFLKNQLENEFRQLRNTGKGSP